MRGTRSSVLVLLLVCVGGCGEDTPAPVAPAPKYAMPLGVRVMDLPPLTSARTPKRLVDLGDYMGKKATVLAGWKIGCPCTPMVEARIRKLRAGYGPGLAWFAISGTEGETPAQVVGRLRRSGADYDVLLDPRRLVLRPLGIEQACQVIVLDAERRLVYRGGFDDNLEGGQAETLKAVLDAVMAGKKIEPREQAAAYGCPFDD